MASKILSTYDSNDNPTFDNAHISWDYEATVDSYGSLSTQLIETVWTHINCSHETRTIFHCATSKEIQEMADKLADLAKRVKEYEEAFHLVNS